MKKFFAIVLVLVIAMSCCIFSTNAAIPPQLYGDVDSDLSISVIDATTIQFYLAQKGDIHYKSYEAADVDGDACISIIDATYIQLYIAGKITEFPAGEYFFIDAYFYDLIADYDSGKAMVGVPVTFFANGFSDPGPSTAKLYVNDELVVQASESSDENYDFTLSYEFEQAGVYQVSVTICDKWGYGRTMSFEDYEVVEQPADKSIPVITSIRRDSTISTTPVITAYAQFGTAPYQYMFILKACNYIGLEGEYTVIKSSQGFSEDNTFEVKLEGHGEYEIEVIVKDANGNEAFASKNIAVHIIDPA